MIPILLVAFIGVFSVALTILLALPKTHSENPGKSIPLRKGRAPDVRKVIVFSAIPWLNHYLKDVKIAPTIKLWLYQAELKWTVGGILLASLSATVFPAYMIWLVKGSLSAALIVGTPLGFVPTAIVMFRRSRRFAKFEEELPNTLDLLVSALRAGHSFNAALGLVSRETPEPVRSEFKVCFDEQNYGLDLRQAMQNLMVRVPLTDLRIAATAVLIQKETGGNLAEVLNNTSDLIRERARLTRQVRVHTAHGRLTGWVIGLLPVALLIILFLINPQLESLLWKREIGVKLLYAGGIMMVIGGLIIRRIVNMEV